MSRMVTMALLAILIFLFVCSSQAKLPTFDEKAVVKIFVYNSVDTASVPLDDRVYTFALPQAGHGSGTLIDSSGVILTAKHVGRGPLCVSVYSHSEVFLSCRNDLHR